MVNHDIRLLIVTINQATILHGLLTLGRYWACDKINKWLWLRWDTIVVTYRGLDHCWWRLVTTSILNKGTMISWVWECVSHWVIQRTSELKDYSPSIFFYGNLTYVPYKMMSSPQSVHGFRQSIRDYSVLPPNWRDDLS